MGDLRRIFRKAMGKPDPVSPVGVHFDDDGEQLTFESYVEDVGAGWFKERFIYLFGEGLEPLVACVHAWRFLAGALPRAQVIGQNAYGALVVNLDRKTVNVGIIDPWRIDFSTDPNFDVGGLIGSRLPDNELAGFLDDRLFRQWQKATGMSVDVGEMLSLKVPLALGGEATLENLELVPMVEYYEASGPVFAKAAGKRASRGKSKGRVSRRARGSACSPRREPPPGAAFRRRGAGLRGRRRRAAPTRRRALRRPAS